ncbi:MFS transporter [Pseudomonas massiliensis]|uniref:MFS transporter n=1 Tax=Pseudomonas massiliensis TaxID=522492 RepID=UPI000693C815|nr:MFS transporter [Pseudomonas massiliensis]
MKAEPTARWPQATLLLLGSCLPVLGAVLLAPVLPRMQAHFAEVPGAAVLVPLSLTLPALVVALLAPFAGIMADRVGRKPLLCLALALYSLCGLLPLWLPSLGAIIASRAGIGLAEAAIMTACTTLMGDYYSGPRRQRLFALQMVATSLSAAIFMGLGGVLGAQDWRAPFWLYACGLLFLPLVWRLLWEPKPSTLARPEERVGNAWSGLQGFYGLAVIAGVSLFIVPIQGGFRLGLLGIEDPAAIGATMAANQLGVVAGALGYRWLGQRTRRALVLAFICAGSGGAWLALATSQPAVAAAVTLNGLGVGMLLPTLIGAIMARVPFAQRGRASGLFTAAIFAGEFASPLCVLALNGGALDQLPRALLIIAGAQLLIGAACLGLGRLLEPGTARPDEARSLTTQPATPTQDPL